MYKYILLLILAVPLTAIAAIYKSIDSNGDVVFSDKPSPDSTKIPTPSPNTVHLPDAPPPGAKIEKKQAGNSVYKNLAVLSPTANETIRSNPGILDIKLKLTPKLNTKAGDSLDIMVDNYVLLRRTTQLNINIPDINRGTHTLQAIVTNRQGDILIKSDNVRFFMKRASILNKYRAK